MLIQNYKKRQRRVGEGEWFAPQSTFDLWNIISLMKVQQHLIVTSDPHCLITSTIMCILAAAYSCEWSILSRDCW